MKTTCILIGSSHYESDKIPDIPLCQNDLKFFSETIQKHLSIPETSIHIVGAVKPDTAKRSNILRIINNASALANDSDCLIIYYTGHGVSVGGESYFLAYDTEPDLLQDTAISVKRIESQFATITAVNKLFIIDSCFSGVTFGKAIDTTSDFSKSLDALSGAGWTILSSCKGDEYSWFYDEKDMSVFTYFFLEGIKGNALRPPETDTLPFEDLYLYVSRKVAEWAVNNGRSQSPTIRGAKTGTILFKLLSPSVLSGPAFSPVSTAPPALTISLTSNYIADKGFWSRSFEFYIPSAVIYDPFSFQKKTQKEEPEWISCSDEERIEMKTKKLSSSLSGLQADLLNHIQPSSIKVESDNRIVLPFGHLDIEHQDPFSFALYLKIDPNALNDNTQAILNNIDSQETVKWHSILYEYSTTFDFDRITAIAKGKDYRILEFDVFEKRMVVNVTPKDKSKLLMKFCNANNKGTLVISEGDVLRPNFFEVVPIAEMLEIFSTSFNK